MAGRKKKARSSKEPLTPRMLRRELKRLDRDLDKARSRRDQAQARLEALEVLGMQLAADLDAAVAAEAWVAEGAAVAEAAEAAEKAEKAEKAEQAEAAQTTESSTDASEAAGTSTETGTSREASTADPPAGPVTPATGGEPVPISASRPRRRRTPPATPPAETA